MEKIKVIADEKGIPVVVIPNILFRNKQNIDWDAVEQYLRKYVGEIVIMSESKDVIYVGKDFPDEYAGSNYTRKLRGARSKVKANASGGLLEIIRNASNKRARENYKVKHKYDAKNGWYYYSVRFALPIYKDEIQTNEYNVYSGRILVNCTNSGRMYLYDLVDIKKEASNPLKIT